MEEPGLGALQQPLGHPFARALAPGEAVVAPVDPLYLELLTGFDPILLAKLGRHDELTLGRHPCSHDMCKMRSYWLLSQPQDASSGGLLLLVCSMSS